MDEMTSPLVLTIAYAADLVAGDPQWGFHPIRLVGRLIAFFEKVLRAHPFSRAGEKTRGVVLCAGVVLLVYAAVWLLLMASFRVHEYAGICVSVVLVYFTISVKALGDAARAVLARLASGDVAGARTSLALVVGRDTTGLSGEEVARAAVETVAENTSDGIVAPLFYVALGGPALGMAYKAVNTLDSMVGYKNGRYRHMGWASARCDDMANYLPARLTGLLLVAAAVVARRDWRGAYAMMCRDARKHLSPNSGYPESAMAGALGVQLGGPSSYQGILRHAALLGEQKRPLTGKTIQEAVRMMYLVSALMMLLCLLYRGAIS
jgi:adenosylcobinamide-phosphate synthase